MKTITTRELNRHTARVLDAVERGEIFELRRKGKAVAYLTDVPPCLEREPNWKMHFQWLRQQSKARGLSLLKEFEQERRRLRHREKTLGNLT